MLSATFVLCGMRSAIAMRIRRYISDLFFPFWGPENELANIPVHIVLARFKSLLYRLAAPN